MKHTSQIRPDRTLLWIRLFGILILVAMLAGNLSLAEAWGEPPSLFVDAAPSQSRADALMEPSTARLRMIRVNTGMLYDAAGKPLDRTRLPEVSLNLFPDANYTGVVTSMERDRWATYWIGDLKEVDGYFYLVMADDVFIAHVASPLGVYEISWAGGDLYKVEQVDQSKFVDEDPAAQYDLSDGALTDEPSGLAADSAADVVAAPAADSAASIDVMVAYTADARAAAGDENAMKARIVLAIKQTNTSYAKSGVTTRLRLVHVEEVAYTETGNLGTDLNRLKGRADGFMDEIHSIRNTYGADMVALIVKDGGSECGRAAAVRANANTAFQVTVLKCATSNYSLAHEFGHLQGARHDTYVDKKNKPYSYGHGYVHLGNTPADRWRTIMGENDQCKKKGYNCTRLQYWSNSTKKYRGAPMGNTQARNYRVLNTTARTVANFRKQVIAANFNSTFNGSSVGWTTVAGTWNIFNKVQYRSPGLPDSFASAKHAGVYGDLTYEVKMKRTGVACSVVKCANQISIRGTPSPLDSINRWNKEYKFAYSNYGSYSVWLVNGEDAATPLQDWTESSAVVKDGWNILKVVAVGPSFKFYINGTLVWVGSDSALRTGQVGFGFYREAGAGTLYVDWAKLSTTPTANLDLNEVVENGFQLPGGSDMGSP